MKSWTVTYQTIFGDGTSSSDRELTVSADTAAGAIEAAEQGYFSTEMSFPGIVGHMIRNVMFRKKE